DDPPSVIGMQPGRGAGITLGEDAVSTLRAEAVVHVLPLRSLLPGRRRRQLELRQRCTKIETGPACYHGRAAGRHQLVDRRVRQLRVLRNRSLVFERPDPDEPGRTL